MKFGVRHQESYSRGELILRTLFGGLYIALPHVLALMFLMIGSMFINIIAFWSILITGKFPEGMFNYQLNLQRWSLRVNARLMNLSDGYPAFGLSSQDPNIIIELERQEKYNRLSVLARAIFGLFYVYLPHFICLYFLFIGFAFVRIIAFFAVLFTGKFPAGMHSYMVGLFRWIFRINAYMSYLTDKYPPFSMKGDEADFDQKESSDLLDS